MTEEKIDPEGKNIIIPAMLAVMEDVDFIEKDSFNKFGGYSYASEQAIKTAVRAALLKHGLVFQLSTMGPPAIHKTERVDKAGEVHNDTFLTLEFIYRLWHVSGQHIDGTFIGSGNARDDKGSYAAITGAIKYILTSLFLIPTGSDAEAEGQAPVKKNVAQVGRGDLRKPAAQSDSGPSGACPNCGKTDSVIKGRDEYGGGWVCYRKKNDGCGHKWQTAATNKNLVAVPVGGNEPPPYDDDDLPF